MNNTSQSRKQRHNQGCHNEPDFLILILNLIIINHCWNKIYIIKTFNESRATPQKYINRNIPNMHRNQYEKNTTDKELNQSQPGIVFKDYYYNRYLGNEIYYNWDT